MNIIWNLLYSIYWTADRCEIFSRNIVADIHFAKFFCGLENLQSPTENFHQSSRIERVWCN